MTDDEIRAQIVATLASVGDDYLTSEDLAEAIEVPVADVQHAIRPLHDHGGVERYAQGWVIGRDGNDRQVLASVLRAWSSTAEVRARSGVPDASVRRSLLRLAEAGRIERRPGRPLMWRLPRLGPDETKVRNAIARSPMTFDELLPVTGLSPAELEAALHTLAERCEVSTRSTYHVVAS